MSENREEEEAKKAGGRSSEQVPQTSEQRLDGNDFLSHLRASGGMPTHNDVTIGASNEANHSRDISGLSGLFDHTTGSTSPGSTTAVPHASPAMLRPRPPAMHSRDRSVSWGKNDLIHQSLMQPNLDDPASSIPHYTVNDMLNSGPYEQEVETNILRALEETRRARADTGTSTILSNVPDEVAHDFSLDQSQTQDSERSSSSDRETSRSSSHAEQSRKLLHKETHNRKAHRRTMSVEQTLAGLTTAMSALDDKVTTIDEEEEPTSSPAEQLAQNAALLTRHDENEHPRPTPKDRWNHLLNNLPTLREAEGREELDETEHRTSEDTNEEEQEGNVDDLEAGVSQETNPPPKRNFKPTGSESVKKTMNAANDKFAENWELWTSFFQPRKEHMWSYVKLVLLYVIIPLTGIAAILFYAANNPPTGKSQDDSSGDQASASWWLLFVVRQVITFSLALLMQLLIIDFLALGTQIVVRLIGPILTLLIVQSKGYPFVVFWWSIFDFAMLYGGDFARHWLYWQDAIDLCNARNPSGHVVDSVWNMRVLTIAISVSVAVAVKRFLVGLYMARQTYAHYGQKLARVMNKMLLVSEVGGLAKEIEKASKNRTIVFSAPSEKLGKDHFQFPLSPDDDDSTAGTSKRETSIEVGGEIIDMTNRDPLTGSLHPSEKLKIMQLLERWEEPERYANHHSDEVASISAVLRFRNALAMMQKQYPFSYAFGPADAREACIESAQKVYLRLLMRTPDETSLHFDTLALIALQKDGTIDQEKARDLMKLYRPDRQGNLTMLDFLKSTDRVYKEYRLLQASIQNSSRIDLSLEKISNWIFYLVVVTIILAALGLDPFALFLSLSSIVLAFAFMIGSASSKYFEGLLFILVRRPYNIGDLINVSGVETQTSFDGAPGWIVENVTLFETECTWAPTNERASLSNGSLANSRIINWARSPHSQFHIFLNFPINTPYDKILIFKSAVEEYMKARPREWLSLNGFRANRMMPDKGIVEYLLVIMHRDGWQMIGQVLDSKANLTSYCMEVTKQLGLSYRAPPLPVDLTYSKDAADKRDSVTEEVDNESRLQEARSIVHKHNIRLG